jgi:hypothetical protein
MNPTIEKLRCRISYRGAFGPDAENLAHVINQVTGELPLIKQESPDAELGIEHLVLTILASAALKAVFSVVLEELRKYLIDFVRRRGKKHPPHEPGKAFIILDIKGLGLKHPRSQLDLENLKEEAVDKFIEEVREIVLDAAKSTAKT